jgi:signal transduction histidine kinase
VRELASKLNQRLGYVAVIGGCFGIALVIAWRSPAKRVNNFAYDWMLARSANQNWIPQSVVVAIDERTLSARGGMPGIRGIEAEALDEIAAAKPAAVALDVIIHDATRDADDTRVEAALLANRNVVLPCVPVIDGAVKRWENPLPRFKGELGHVALREGTDGVTREFPLQEIANGEHRDEQRFALPLVALSLARRQPIVETPEGLEIGDVSVPALRETGRSMFIRYLRSGIRTISAMDIARSREAISGKVVFFGITALSAARDRRVTPYGQEVPGVEVHAHAYETLARGKFLTASRGDTELMICALIAILAGLIFALRSGWQAYTLGALLIAGSFWMPVEFFRHDIVFPFFAPLAVAWMSTMGASVYQHFFVRRDLRRSESEKSRYQQAIHWVAHEMRTPLTAIQGSSEIMTRYALPDAKRHELSEMINSESKRLARMIQTFLDVERLADGQMEMKREPFNICDVASSCYKRAVPIAERKKINVVLDTSMDAALVGDRELMEYALYNLLTNAIKYSPKETEVQVFAKQRGSELRLSVTDQGMGMSAEEVKKIFTKFYRTKGAEISGEVGTGIGLSIVEQIVTHHGGRMEVTSEPGKGSCFTMVLKAEVAATPNAETVDRRG